MNQDLNQSEPIKQTTIKFPNREADSHLSFVFNNYLYMIECYGAQPDKQQKMHMYSVKENTWKLTSVVTCRTKQGVYYPKKGASCVFVGGNLYCFGGKENKGQPDNRLASFNLDKKTWKADFDLLNSQTPLLAPEPRCNANLGSYRNKFLILYGGTFISEDEAMNSLWIFDIEKTYWHRVSNLVLPYLENSTLCLQDDKIYILGYSAKAQSTQLLEIKIQNTEEKDRFPLAFQKMEVLSNEHQKQSQPERRNFYQIFPCKNKTLLLFESNELSKQAKTKIRIFDKPIQRWTMLGVSLPFQPAQILELGENNFVCLEKWANSQASIRKLIISPVYVKKLIDQVRYQSWRSCEICYEAFKNQNLLMQPAFKLTRQMMQTLTEKINFPLACFGIFAENALTLSATYINIHYMNYRQHPIIKIEDDIRLNYTNQQLQEIIVNFSAETNYNFSSVQRRARGILAKDYLKKEFGTNLKIAGLRLGSELLFISSTPSYEARVAYFTLEGDEYVCYYYAFEEKTNKTIDDYSIETKLFVQSKFGDLIAQSIHENPGSLKYGHYKNSLYILGLKTVANQLGKEAPQLQPLWSLDNKDIIYISPNPLIYKTYFEYGCKINEAIDVSLASYLAQFFIKNEHMKISIQIFESEKKFIKREEQPELTEKGSSVKFVSTGDTSLKNFDLKLVELMFNSRLNKKIGVFHNGILLYHKNRLVKRFGCDLGDLLNCLEFTQKVSYGYFNVFGRIQLPDSLEVNQQKTDFVNKLMVQKLYTKINALNQILLTNVENEKDEGKTNNQKQGPKLRSRGVQDYQLRHTPIKKVKRSIEDQSYHGN